MNCKTILLAIDFSPCSQQALVIASALASQRNALLLIVHVEEPPVAMANELLLMADYFPNPEIRRMVEAIVPPDEGVRYEHRVVTGLPADQIVRLADEEQADLIVVGTHGRSGLTRLLMGSVAENVVRYATCPVLTVKAATSQAAAQPAEKQASAMSQG